MALFPDAAFQVFFPANGVVPGTRAEGTLAVEIPEDIPRADHIHLFWRTRAVAGYGSGKNRHVYANDMFVSPLEVKLDRNHPLKAGSYSYPFAIDLPPWLPPSYVGADCRIEHVIEVRLDVDWAVDPKARVTPVVQMAPIEIVAEPVATRSPAGFHDRFVVDLKLDRQCFAEGEPVTGQIALRSGHDARFDAITVAVASMATIRMGRGERRRGHGSQVRIPAEYLRSGASVPFSVHYNPTLVRETFRNGFIDHDVYVVVEVDIPWASDPAFELPIQMLPAGSRIHLGGQNAVMVGTERLVRLAEGMAAATGFARGRLPTLVEGWVGPVGVVITDAPREGRLGIDIAFDFPDLGLGTNFRPLGMLEGFRQSPLLPVGLANHYLLRAEPKVPVSQEALAAFYGAVLSGFEATSEVRLTDHHLGVRQPLANDGADAMTALAQWTRARAEIIAQAMTRLPFAPQYAGAAPAWTATAAEQNAFLLPHLPALTGLLLVSRIAGGEQRAIRLELRTRPDGTIAAELDLRGTPLPRAAWAELEKGTDVPGLRAVRAVFPRTDVHTVERVTLEGAAFAADPRALLSTVETFFWWLLEQRHESRADAPYR
jgi:hypothetical protein